MPKSAIQAVTSSSARIGLQERQRRASSAACGRAEVESYTRGLTCPALLAGVADEDLKQVGDQIRGVTGRSSHLPAQIRVAECRSMWAGRLEAPTRWFRSPSTSFRWEGRFSRRR